VSYYHQFNWSVTEDSVVARIRLLRRLALSMNGVDVSDVEVGAVMALADQAQR
jgi:hypothetical protein